MSKPFPLQTVLELMQSRTDDAARELGRRIAAEKDARAQLGLLEDYRREYAERFRDAASSGMGWQQMQNFRGFMARLDEAIGQQARIVSGNEQKTADGQRQWLDQKNRLQAIDTLADRHRSRERTMESRREQKTSDELAARRHPGDRDND